MPCLCQLVYRARLHAWLATDRAIPPEPRSPAGALHCLRLNERQVGQLQLPSNHPALAAGGIGHTRWAPMANLRNAMPPHLDGQRCRAIRMQSSDHRHLLTAAGECVFRSETHTKSIPLSPSALGA